MIVMRKVAYFVSAAILAGCGGGGSTPSSVTTSTTIQTVPEVAATLSVDKEFVRVGQTLTIQWSSNNATECNATGSWTGVKAKSGSETFEVKDSGRLLYTIECKNQSTSSAKASKSVVVPYVVYNTSYENKNNIVFDQTQIPSIRRLNLTLDSDEQDSVERSVSFGDFFQEGKYSAFVSVGRYKGVYGNNNKTSVPDSPAKTYFLSQDDKGNWIDRTKELLKSTTDRDTCVSVSYSLTADFNNDKVPDIFLSCTGIDVDLGDNFNGFNSAYLEYQYIYVSQTDKTYKKIQLPYKLYAHQASAADLNNDGNIDIAIVNQTNLPTLSDRSPFVLLGNGDGTFVKDTKIIPGDLFTNNNHELVMGNTYQIQLIPIDSRLDIIFMGHKASMYFKGKTGGGFDKTSAKTIVMPNSLQTGQRFDMPLDVLYKDNNYYFMTTSHYNDGVQWAILKYDANFTASNIIYSWNNLKSDFMPYSAQIKPSKTNTLKAYTAGCFNLVKKGMCDMDVKL